jgi:hypothetical protein
MLYTPYVNLIPKALLGQFGKYKKIQEIRVRDQCQGVKGYEDSVKVSRCQRDTDTEERREIQIQVSRRERRGGEECQVTSVKVSRRYGDGDRSDTEYGDTVTRSTR